MDRIFKDQYKFIKESQRKTSRMFGKDLFKYYLSWMLLTSYCFIYALVFYNLIKGWVRTIKI